MKCNSCGETFETYKDLAIHIMSSKKGHRQGKIWASKYLSKQRILDRKVSMQSRNHSPFTEQDRENRREAERVLSGNIANTRTICPKCKSLGIYQFPIEHTESKEAWRIGGSLVKLCIRCGGS